MPEQEHPASMPEPKWFEALPPGRAWATLWSGYIRCSCGGIQPFGKTCPACDGTSPGLEFGTFDDDGAEHKYPQTFMGAEGRYEDWVYLQMLEREWSRPVTDADRFLDIGQANRPSPKAVVVLVFWTYFETRIERLLVEAMRSLPESVSKDLLRRYSPISARLEKLYKVLFGTTYWVELKDIGFAHVAELLRRVHESRNRFAHGHPEAIDDALVSDLVAGLKDEHESWIRAFNRAVRRTRSSP